MQSERRGGGWGWAHVLQQDPLHGASVLLCSVQQAEHVPQQAAGLQAREAEHGVDSMEGAGRWTAAQAGTAVQVRRGPRAEMAAADGGQPRTSPSSPARSPALLMSMHGNPAASSSVSCTSQGATRCGGGWSEQVNRAVAQGGLTRSSCE